MSLKREEAEGLRNVINFIASSFFLLSVKLLPKPEFTVHLSSFLPVTSFVDPRFRAKRYRGCWIINANNAPRPSIKSHFPEHYMIPKELERYAATYGKSKINSVEAHKFVRGGRRISREDTHVNGYVLKIESWINHAG